MGGGVVVGGSAAGLTSSLLTLPEDSLHNATRDSVFSLGSALSAAEQHMLTSLYDIRLEIKDEMDMLHHKMNRIDERVAEMLRFFSPLPTPCSSMVSTYPSSKYNSPQNATTSNSAQHTPQDSNSTVSSPGHRKSAEQGSNKRGGGGGEPTSSTASGGGHADSHPPQAQQGAQGGSMGAAQGPPPRPSRSPPARRRSQEVQKMRKVGKVGEASPVVEAGDGRQGSAGRARRRVSGEAMPQTRIPKPGEVPAPTDDEKQLHVKDRDLDIL